MISGFETRIFITGIYRSGTTLVSRMLNNHSKLWVTYDSVHFMRFSYGKYEPIRDADQAMRLVQEIHDRILKRWKMEFNLDKAISEIRKLKKIEYKHIYDIVMKALASDCAKIVTGWGEKTNVCWGQIPNFLQMFPSGKVIHVLRDPRDVLCSYREMTYEPGYSYLDSVFCSQHSFQKAVEYRETLDPDNYYILKYENFVDNPLTEAKRLCKFLRIKFEPAMLDVKQFKDRQGRRWTGDSSFNKKMNTVSSAPAGRWKKSADPFEIFFAELVNNKVMQHFGYELSGIKIRRSFRERLDEILLENGLLKERYDHWQKTGEGVEAYPSLTGIKKESLNVKV
ncbi:MAG: sulfotransferase [Candidatus Omnitrophota bacterium]